MLPELVGDSRFSTNTFPSWDRAGVLHGNSTLLTKCSEYAAVEYNFASHWDRSAPRSRLPARHVSAGAPRTWRINLEVQL